jgi:hypothetical protein
MFSQAVRRNFIVSVCTLSSIQINEKGDLRNEDFD